MPGQWISDWWGSFYIPGNYQETREIYNYDGAGRLIEIRLSAGTAIDESSYNGTIPSGYEAPSGSTVERVER